MPRGVIPGALGEGWLARCDHRPSAELRIWPGLSYAPVYQRQCVVCLARVGPRSTANDLLPAQVLNASWRRKKKRPTRRRREYLRWKQSTLYRRLRKERLELDDWTCVWCEEEATEAHQVHYPADLFNTALEDLRSICQDCHDSIHTRRNDGP